MENPDFSTHKFPSMSQILEEIKELWSMVFPITAMRMLVFIRAVVSVLFLGRLGKLELAGGALSIGFTNITGYSVLAGLASGLEPVCSQAYGGKKWDLLSLSLQRMVFILLMASIPISLLWLNLEDIMNFMGQDREITAMAGIYCFYSLPDLLTNTLLQPLRVYLLSQQVARPMMFCSLIAVVFHVPLNFWLVRYGVAGVATASVVTNLNMVVLMAAYVMLWRTRERGMRWVWGWEVVEEGWWELIKVAVPSCLGICLEWWWYEIVTVLAGYLENPTVALAATGILFQTTSMMYTVPMALAGCVSTRVGNELGAGKPYKAKLAAMIALGCAFVMGFINVTWTVILRHMWAGFFTKDEFVKALVASVMPIMGLCELGNCPQTTGCGILRGTARPVVGAHINLISFYFVGTPVAVGLAFWFNIGFSGLWFGLLSAQVACAVSILYVVIARTDWEAESLRAEKLTRATNGLESGLELIAKDMNDEKDEETKQFLMKGSGNKEEMC